MAKLWSEIWRQRYLSIGFYGTARTMHVLATPYKSRGIVFLPLLSNLGIMASKNPQIGVELSRGFTVPLEVLPVPVCVNQGFIVIELRLSYEPSAHLRWRTLSVRGLPNPYWATNVLVSSAVHGARI